MVHIYKYAILKAVPNARRGERVNIGIVVFQNDGLDVRFSDIAKLRALSAGDWDKYIVDVANRFKDSFSSGDDPEGFSQKAATFENIVRMSEISWFSVISANEYESRISEILSALIIRPKEPRKIRTSRINTEIAKELRRIGALAKDGEGIEDHKVVRDCMVSEEEDLQADFVYRNGVYHVSATLDLRRDSVHISQATWKAIILAKARTAFSEDAIRYAVYAAPSGMTQFKAHLALLEEYSDKLVNWDNPSDRAAYMDIVAPVSHMTH